MRLFVFARHAETALNEAQIINGDPTLPTPLTEKGRGEADLLGRQLRNAPLDLCLVSRFPRARETAELALGSRPVPVEVEPLLDDVDVGDLEGLSIDDYRAWKRVHDRSEPFPNGESLDDAAARYGRALASLLARAERAILVIAHEIPVRYTLNAAEGSPDPDAPHRQIANATPYVFGEERLARAAAQLGRPAA